MNWWRSSCLLRKHAQRDYILAGRLPLCCLPPAICSSQEGGEASLPSGTLLTPQQGQAPHGQHPTEPSVCLLWELEEWPGSCSPGRNRIWRPRVDFLVSLFQRWIGAVPWIGSVSSAHASCSCQHSVGLRVSTSLTEVSARSDGQSQQRVHWTLQICNSNAWNNILSENTWASACVRKSKAAQLIFVYACISRKF